MTDRSFSPSCLLDYAFGIWVGDDWRGIQGQGVKQRRVGAVTERRLIAFMNSYSQAISGGDACFIEMAKRMNKFEKIVVTSLLGKKLCEVKGLTASCLITTRENKFKNIIRTYFVRIIKAIFLKLEIGDGDILYSTSDFLPDVLPAFYQKIKNSRVSWVQKVFHLIPSDRIIPYLAQKLSFFFIKHYSDLVIVDNHLLKQVLIRLGFKEGRVKVNTPGIDFDYFSNIKPLEGKRYDAVFLGRLHPSKGIFDIVDIWKLVCEVKASAKLAIIGDGDEKIKQELMNKIKGAELDYNIDMFGYLEDDDMFGIVKSSRVFISPSHEEGFGIAILEAMACSLPVVAWDLEVYSEVFPKGMIKVPAGNNRDFAEEVLKLLYDVEWYYEISKGTEEISHRYDWKKITQRELELIKNLMDDKKE
jgi:glycosyltransferase involved in cell wall biosynthesis